MALNSTPTPRRANLLAEREPLYSGKVRDLYNLGDGRLLLMASDRISAFDHVMPTLIPDKGATLTKLSALWFKRTAAIVPNHHIASSDHNPEGLPGWLSESQARRAMVVRRAERLPIECIVRGYIAGSAWRDYQRNGRLNGVELPAGLLEAQRLPEPLFTPSTKADAGHDEPLSEPAAINLVGAGMHRRLKRASLNLYSAASELLLSRGLILADTKFEFGLINGELTLIDELLTPDSSRFWELATWRPGTSPEPLDKEFLRSWLLQRFGSPSAVVPQPLPGDVVADTAARYDKIRSMVV